MTSPCVSVRRTHAPGTDPEVLREATARMNALGIDGNVVLVTRDRSEMMTFLGVSRRRVRDLILREKAHADIVRPPAS